MPDGAPAVNQLITSLGPLKRSAYLSQDRGELSLVVWHGRATLPFLIARTFHPGLKRSDHVLNGSTSWTFWAAHEPHTGAWTAATINRTGALRTVLAPLA